METYKVSLLSDVGKTNWVELKKQQRVGKQVLVKIAATAVCTLEQRIYKGVMRR